MDILGDTSGAPRMLQNRGRGDRRGARRQGRPAVTVDIDTLKKDLTRDGRGVEAARLVGARGRRRPARLPGAPPTAGIGGKDCVQMPVFWSGKPKKA